MKGEEHPTADKERRTHSERVGCVAQEQEFDLHIRLKHRNRQTERQQAPRRSMKVGWSLWVVQSWPESNLIRPDQTKSNQNGLWKRPLTGRGDASLAIGDILNACGVASAVDYGV